MDLRSMEVRTFPADAIIVCTGGIGAIFGKSTNSVVCTGSAQSALYQQGVYYANGEFIQVHPTSIPGEDKLRLMSESARGEGGRVWVPKKSADQRDPKSIPESERWYFLEEWYPKYGNRLPYFGYHSSRKYQRSLSGMDLGSRWSADFLGTQTRPPSPRADSDINRSLSSPGMDVG